ncbi:MAG: carboxypeptidase-like regulatory domain-containing protein [Bacteroidales bacterium]|nr:carboxypeptidase-like regulatory domain-containing protein [Bacteroidales bacterium]
MAASACLASCSLNNSVEGYVMDALGTSGVPGIEVRMGHRTAVTDATGRYCFEGRVPAMNRRLVLNLEDRTAEYAILKSDFADTSVVTVPDFYSGYDIRNGVKIQKVGDLYKYFPKPVTVEAVQGLAIDGDEMFVFYNNGGYDCYNMKTSRYEYSGDIDPENQYRLHCNEAFFGLEKAFPDSEHNLVYISECSTYFNVYLYDISSKGSTLYGTLSMPYPIPTSSYSLDAENRYLYAHNDNWIRRYRFPELSEFKDGALTLEPEDFYGEVNFEPWLTIPQGACARGHKLYMPSGWPSNHCYIYVYDFDKETVELVDIQDFGIEPEGIDEVGGWFYVAFNHWGRAVVYRFQFPED